MAGIIILLVFICLVIALLIMPIHLRTNQEGARPGMDKPAFLKLNIDLESKNLVTVVLYVFFVRFTWYPLQKTVITPVRGEMPSNEKRFDLPKWNTLKFILNIEWQSIRRAKLNKLYLDLDTSNVIVNANLFPVFELINERPQIDLNINYSGNFALNLDVQNNLWNIMRIVSWNLLKRTFIFTKNKYYGIQSR